MKKFFIPFSFTKYVTKAPISLVLPIPVAIEKQTEGKARSNSSNNEQSFFIDSIFFSVFEFPIRSAFAISESNNSSHCIAYIVSRFAHILKQ